MAQTFSEFKTYLTDMLWRQNDTDLSNNLNNLIRMANHELNRKLTIQKREVAATITPETEDYTLDAEFYQMMSLTNRQPARQRKKGEMRLTTLSTIYQLREAGDSAYIEPYYYPQRGETANTLYLVGPFSASNPGELDIQYRTTIPDYETEDSSWVEDEYLDLYVYTVFKHCAMFLREDERMMQYAGYMQDALDSALDEDLRQVRFGGSPLDMKPHRYVPRTRRKL